MHAVPHESTDRELVGDAHVRRCRPERFNIKNSCASVDARPLVRSFVRSQQRYLAARRGGTGGSDVPAPLLSSVRSPTQPCRRRRLIYQLPGFVVRNESTMRRARLVPSMSHRESAAKSCRCSPSGRRRRTERRPPEDHGCRVGSLLDARSSSAAVIRHETTRRTVCPPADPFPFALCWPAPPSASATPASLRLLQLQLPIVFCYASLAALHGVRNHWVGTDRARTRSFELM